MKLLIVSFRNTCRGPMAGALARRIAAQKGLVADIETAGMPPYNKSGVAALAAEAMTQIGIDISQHEWKPITAQRIEWADVVIAVDPNLGLGLRLQYPDVAEKIIDLGKDVPDPRRPGATLDDFVSCRDVLDTLLRRLAIFGPSGRIHASGATHYSARARGFRAPASVSSRTGVV
jgi:protein-tyrosine-phosphatase